VAALVKAELPTPVEAKVEDPSTAESVAASLEADGKVALPLEAELEVHSTAESAAAALDSDVEAKPAKESCQHQSRPNWRSSAAESDAVAFDDDFKAALAKVSCPQCKEDATGDVPRYGLWLQPRHEPRSCGGRQSS
jgi:hypothetical protein